MNLNVIPRRKSHCSLCNTPFAPESIYFSQLFEEGKIYLRRDFCLTCNKSDAKSLTTWKGKVPSKKEERRPEDKHERALELLLEALDAGSQQEAFVLALFLVRHRKLAARKELPEGKILYEVLATEEMILVPKLPIGEIEVANIQAKIAQQLCGTK